MATPAAVLSILVAADTTAATAKLTKYDKQLAAVNEVSKKGIETRLSGKYNPEAFTQYEQALSRAARIAKDRAAFKAELGANFNNRAFNQYQKAVDKAEVSTKTTASETKRLSGSFGTLAKSVVAAGGAFVAFDAAKEAIDSTVELGHSVERLSAVTGLDTKQASSWIESLKVRNVQTKQVSQSFISLSKNIKAGEAGTKAAKTAFDQLGITQEFLRTHSTEDVLLATADGLKGIKSPAERAAFAQQLFGRAAQGLLPVLTQGSQGVKDMLAQTQKYGAFLPTSNKATAGAVEAQRNLMLANDGLKISFTEAVLPALVKAAQGILNFIVQMRSGQGAGGQFAAAIARAFGTVKSVVTGVVSAVGGLGNAVGLLVAAFVASKIIAFGSALKDLWALMAENPITAVIGVIGFLVTAFTALSGHQQTTAQTARDVANAWDAVRNAGNALRDANLAVVQANIDITRTSQGVTQAEQAKKHAFDQFGGKSPQYKQATLDLKQAELDHTQAVDRLSDSIRTAATAQQDQTAKVKTAISTSRSQVSQDQDRIRSLNIQIAALGHQGGQLSQIHAKEQQLSAATQQLTTDQNALTKAINSTPAARLSTIDLNVDFKSNMAGAIAAIAHSIGGQPLSKTPPIPLPGHFTGGMVTQPGYFAGEEAPRHPEVILATNPAYRQRNLGLFAQAGHMLGVPGFATGGITPTTGNMVSGAPPWASGASAAWMKGASNSWLKSAIASVTKTVNAGAGSSSSGGPPTSTHVSGNVASWLAQAMALTGVGGPLWTAMLDRQVQNESSGNPLSINLTDSNAAAGHPSKGLLQTIDSTFNRYALPGHGNIWDPVDNAAAAIRYMIANYGHGNAAAAAQVMWARGGGGYRKGGIHGIPGFAKGGLPYEGKLQNKFANTTSMLRRMWGIAAPYYHQASTKMPPITYTQGQDGLFVGVDFGNGKQPGHRPLYVPNWIVNGQGGKDALSKMDPTMLELLLHEWSHEFQRADIISKVKTPKNVNAFEGGAEANAQRIAPSVLKAMGVSTNFDRGSYVPDTRWVQKNLGANWIANKQFGFRKGGIFGRIPGFKTGGIPGASFTPTLHKAPVKGRLPTSVATSPVSSIIGMPALPNLGGTAPTTIAGAQNLAGTISGLRSRIVGLTSDYGTLDQYFNINPSVLVDPNTGAVNTSAVNKQFAQLDRLVAIRHQIFELWGRVVVYMHRLVEANRAIIAGLQTKLAGIKTKGLKGKALTAAQALQTSTKGSITKYQGNLTSALGTLTTDTNSRTSSWLDVLSTRSQRAAVAATTGSAAATADIPVDTGTTDTGTTDTGIGTGVDNSAQLALLQTLLTQSQQTTAVANAQFSVLQGWQQNMPPFGGSFATGGVVPGPAGSPRTIIAHGGETVGDGMPVMVEVHVHDGAVDPRKIQVITRNATRADARLAGRRLPGSR